MVQTQPCLGNHSFTKVSSKNLDLFITGIVAEQLRHNNRNGIHFLSCRAGRYPYPDSLFSILIFKNFWENIILEKFKSIRLPEETGNIDQQILIKQVQFIGMFLQV